MWQGLQVFRVNHPQGRNSELTYPGKAILEERCSKEDLCSSNFKDDIWCFPWHEGPRRSSDRWLWGQGQLPTEGIWRIYNYEMSQIPGGEMERPKTVLGQISYIPTCPFGFSFNLLLWRAAVHQTSQSGRVWAEPSEMAIVSSSKYPYVLSHNTNDPLYVYLVFNTKLLSLPTKSLSFSTFSA